MGAGLVLGRKLEDSSERWPLQLNIQWPPNPTKQFTSLTPNVPPSVLQSSWGAPRIPHWPTGRTLPIAHAHTSHYRVLK